MKILGVFIALFSEGFLLVGSKYFLEFSLPGTDGKMKSRLYECRNNGVQAGIVQCKRVDWLIHKKWIYYHANFYQSHRALEKIPKIQFSDLQTGAFLPQGGYLGFVASPSKPIDGPDIGAAEDEVLKLITRRVQSWLAIVPPQWRNNLLHYLATPDMKYLFSSSDLTARYFGSYLDTIASILHQHGEKVAKKEDAATATPSGDVAGLSSFIAKDAEKELRRVIPVLSTKMVDPCILTTMPDIMATAGMDVDSLCKATCKYQQLISQLYRKRSSRMCRNLGEGGYCDQTTCRCNQYYRIWVPGFGRKRVPHRVPMIYCNSMFRLRFEESPPSAT
nr:PREDICTED: uncharacterized protein LOC109043537 isoform X1 [Bemisia tabaci]